MEHDQAMTLAETEYARFLALVDRLEPEDWRQPTACPGWDVKAMVAHVLGMVHYFGDGEEQLRQAKAAGERAHQHHVAWIDALTALQVEERTALSPAELGECLRSACPRTLVARQATSAEERAVKFNPGPPYDEEWSRGYLIDVIHTRDVWMHRSDISVSAGHTFVLTADHDGMIVADVVDDWARRHGQAFSLVLTGPGGGSFSQGDGGEQHELDAVEFCRIVSGRGEGAGLLAAEVPF